MRSTQKLISQFNQPDTILVISKYPHDSIGHSHHGVATYTKHQLQAISKQTGKKFVVLVQKEYDRPIEKDGKNILIIPCFDSSKLMFPQIFKTVLKFNQVSITHVHSEFFTSGDSIQMTLVIPFLASLRMLGKTVYYTAHNVIENFDFIARHLGKKKNDLGLKLIEKTVPAYYFLLSRVTNKIITLDEEVKRKLNKYSLAHDLYLSPHWTYPQTSTRSQRNKWRQELGYTAHDFVIVSFGFVSRYKGSDWLVEAMEYIRRKENDKNVHLILAGGKAPSLAGKKYYEDYYSELVEHVAKNHGIILTGFIPEDEISKYFSIADLVILPYRGILGASGSWAQTIAHGKPFLLSNDLESYLKAADVQNVITELKLDQNELLFARNKKSFASLIENLSVNRVKLKKISKFSELIASQRKPEVQIARDLQLYTPQKRWISLQWNKLNHVKEKIQPAFATS